MPNVAMGADTVAGERPGEVAEIRSPPSTMLTRVNVNIPTVACRSTARRWTRPSWDEPAASHATPILVDTILEMARVLGSPVVAQEVGLPHPDGPALLTNPLTEGLVA